jgi:pimeloyl-ACP methyl ester carboxylesterase
MGCTQPCKFSQCFRERQDSLVGYGAGSKDYGVKIFQKKAIKCPVIAIHGKKDPHPWRGVKEPLENRLNEFKMYVIDKCGHDPWKEYYAKEEFFAILKNEMEGSLK